MNKKKLFSLALIFGLFGAGLACGINFSGLSPSEPKEDIAEAVKVQLTVQAIQAAQTALYQSQTQAAAAQHQAEQAAAQQTALAGQPTTAVTVTPTTIPCNLPQFQSETVPDGTQKGAGQHFAKTWRIKNMGSCTWTTNYRLVFVSGDKMGGPASAALAHEVRPGEAIDLIVDLIAPANNGLYTGYWKIQSNEGEQFGNYWVQIRIGSPSATFAVTRVTFDVHPNIDMACPNSVRIKAEISTSAGGRVTYRWRDSASGSSDTTSLTFSEAGSQIVNYKTTINDSGDYTAEVYIDAPNHQWFGPVKFRVYCTP